MRPDFHAPKDYNYIKEKIHLIFDNKPRREINNLENETRQYIRYEDIDNDGDFDVKYTGFLQDIYHDAYLKIDRVDISDQGQETILASYVIQTNELMYGGSKIERYINWMDTDLAEIVYQGNLSENKPLTTRNIYLNERQETNFEFWHNLFTSKNFDERMSEKFLKFTKKN